MLKHVKNQRYTGLLYGTWKWPVNKLCCNLFCLQRSMRTWVRGNWWEHWPNLKRWADLDFSTYKSTKLQEKVFHKYHSSYCRLINVWHYLRFHLELLTHRKFLCFWNQRLDRAEGDTLSILSDVDGRRDGAEGQLYHPTILTICSHTFFSKCTRTSI